MAEQTTEMVQPMKRVRIDKVTLNIGAGKDAQLLEKGVKLLKQLTGIPPVKTITRKRIPGWGLRPGLPIGCKITLRGKQAEEIIPRLLSAKDNTLSENNYDGAGNISFGVPEYIDIDGANYDPEIGIIGLQVCISLDRPGYRVKRRKMRPGKINDRHLIKKNESIEFMRERFGTKVPEEQ